MGIKNIITFGAESRVEKKLEEFNHLRVMYEGLYGEMEAKRDLVNERLEKVIEIKVRSIHNLQKISKISKYIKGRERELNYRKLGNEIEQINFDKIEQTISAGQVAINAAKGVTAGVSTALGAWALVSSVGTASTGTAIASLSGAAATNATLAWFGGGAIAAGGGGIAAGTVVLGGLVVIPALAITAFSSHLNANKKIKEINEKIMELIKTIEKIKGNLMKLDVIEKRANELILSLEKANEVFNQEFKKIYKKIYPVPLWSKFIKYIRKKVFRKNYFSKKDLVHISYIGGIASDFAQLIDTKVID